MEIIQKLREANIMMNLGAKIDLSKLIDELEAHIVAQQHIIDGKRHGSQLRTTISMRKGFVKYLAMRHGSSIKEIKNMNALHGRYANPENDDINMSRLLNGEYIFPLKKRNKRNITFEERKNLGAS